MGIGKEKGTTCVHVKPANQALTSLHFSMYHVQNTMGLILSKVASLSAVILLTAVVVSGFVEKLVLWWGDSHEN